MSDELALPGLDGSNPMAFMAGLGVLAAADRIARAGVVRLAWSDDVLPAASVVGATSIDEIAELLIVDRNEWTAAVALRFDDDVKLTPADLRRFVEACSVADDGGRSVALCQSLIVEESFDGGGLAKPTDLHFTAGQQKFLRMARQLADGVTLDDIVQCLGEDWTYPSELPSFGWDVTDDRVYALSASNPAKTAKRSQPGAEWLALMGLTAFPSFRALGRTVTTACAGTWKAGRLRWPLWSTPMTRAAATSLIGAVPDGDGRRRSSVGLDALNRWSIHRVMMSRIRRSEQGGYGSFSPSDVYWQRQ